MSGTENYITISHVLETDIDTDSSVTLHLPAGVEASLLSNMNPRCVVGQNALIETADYAITITPGDPFEILLFNNQEATWPEGTTVNLSLKTRPQDVYLTYIESDGVVTFTCHGDKGGTLVFGDGHSEPFNTHVYQHEYTVSGRYTVLWLRSDGSVVANDVTVTVPVTP